MDPHDRRKLEPPLVHLGDDYRRVVRAVGHAAVLASRIQRQAPRSHEKSDRSPLTVADLAVQVVLAGVLERIFPRDPLVAEEDTSALHGEDGSRLAEQTLQAVRSVVPEATPGDLSRLLDRGTGSPSERFWTLDPVDGTEGFLRGDHYVVALALVEDYRPTLALLGCPTLDHPPSMDAGHDVARGGPSGLLLLASRGRGTWMSRLDGDEFRPIGVSDVRSLSEARVLRSSADSHIDATSTRDLIRTAGIGRSPILMDSQAKHVALAMGMADLLVRIPARASHRELIWDEAAGALAIEEAGGRISDLDGHPLDFSTGRRLERNRGLVAANQHLHPLIIDILQKQVNPGAAGNG